MFTFGLVFRYMYGYSTGASMPTYTDYMAICPKYDSTEGAWWVLNLRSGNLTYAGPEFLTGNIVT